MQWLQNYVVLYTRLLRRTLAEPQQVVQEINKDERTGVWKNRTTANLGSRPNTFAGTEDALHDTPATPGDQSRISDDE